MFWSMQQPLQDGTDPDPYVKLYLLPDPQKTSKRKTKAARRTCNPTYNEMVHAHFLSAFDDATPDSQSDACCQHLRCGRGTCALIGQFVIVQVYVDRVM